MLKKALEYLVELGKPSVVEIDGEKFCDKHLEHVSDSFKASPIGLTTLRSFVDYCKSGADKMDGTMFIHIQSPTEIALFSTLDKHRSRESIVRVRPQLPTHNFNSYMDHESFCIALQSNFCAGEDKELLLRFAGTVEAGSVTEYGDDGISQKATIKNGIASKSDAVVPNPVVLYPYRTFIEVAQPASRFVFRMSNRNGASCALYEADGGAWKQEAMENIYNYLVEELSGVEHTKFVILR